MEELFPIVDAGSSPAVPHQRFVAVATLKTPNTGCWRNEPQQCAAAGALTEVSSAGQSGGLISRVSRVRVPDFRAGGKKKMKKKEPKFTKMYTDDRKWWQKVDWVVVLMRIQVVVFALWLITATLAILGAMGIIH